MKIMTQVQRLSAVAAVSLLSFSAAAQTADELKATLEENLALPLPVTVIGPLSYDDLSVSEAAGSFDVAITGAALGGAVPVGDISLTLTSDGNGSFEISNAVLPAAIPTPDGSEIMIGGHRLSGVWSADSQAYSTLDYGFDSLSFEDGEGNGMSLAGLTLKDGDGSFELSTGDFKLNPPDDIELSVGASSLTWDTTGPDLPGAYGPIREMAIVLMEEGPMMFIDPATGMGSLYNKLSEYVVGYDSYAANMTIGAVDFKEFRFDETIRNAFTMAGATMDVEGTDFLTDGDVAASGGNMVVSGVTFSDRGRAGFTMDEIRFDFAADGTNGVQQIAQSKALYEAFGNADGMIDAGELLSLYLNFDNLSGAYSVKGLSIDAEGEQTEIASASFGIALENVKSDSTDLVMSIGSGEVTSTAFNELIEAAVPTESAVTVRVAGLPVQALIGAMAGNEISVAAALGDEDAMEEAFASIGFLALGTIMQNLPQIVIEPSNITTPTAVIDADGAFDINPASPVFVSGAADIIITGLEKLSAAAQAASSSDNPEVQQMAFPMMAGLGFAQGFGKAQDDGSLLFALEVNAQGAVTINGTPLPF